MTKDEREKLNDLPRPPRFTGKHRGQYFYRGVRWLGPTNAIGRGTIHWVQDGSHSWGLTTERGA
jgi:hypothetical protein